MNIRNATPEDAAEMLKIYAPVVEATAISFELKPPSVSEFSKRIESYTKTHEWLVAENANGVLGYVYATPHRAREAYRFSVETSVYINSEYRGQGIGKQLYTELFNRLNGREFHNAFAGVAMPNESSEQLHKSVGFEKIGVFQEVGFKFGKWHSVSWWQKGINQS